MTSIKSSVRTDTGAQQKGRRTSAGPEPVQRAGIARPQLMERLRQARCRLVLVNAPVASGKSLFLQDLFRATATGRDASGCCWVDLSRQQDPVACLQQIASVLPSTDCPEPVLPAGGGGDAETALVTGITFQLLSTAQPLDLFIDGLDARRHPALLRHLIQLVLLRHAHVRWYLGVTGTLDPALVSLLTPQDVIQVTAQDLTLGIDEIRQLCGNHAAGRRQADAIFWRTGGWPGAVAVELGSSDAVALCRWVEQQVLRPLDGLKQQDIVGLGLLGEWDGPAAAAVMNISVSQALLRLRELRQQGYMEQVRDVDGADQRFRWQHPLRDYLLGCLQGKDAAQLPDMYLRASYWLDDSLLEQWLLQVPLLECPSWALLLAGRICRRWMQQHDSHRILRLLDALDERAWLTLPNLALSRVWALINEHRLDAAAELLQRITVASPYARQDSALPFPAIESTCATFDMLLRYHGGPLLSRAQRVALLEMHVDKEGLLQPLLLNTYSTIQYSCGMIEGAKISALRASRCSRQQGNEVQYQIARSMMTVCEFMQGNVDVAWHQATTDAAELAHHRSLSACKADTAIEYAIAINNCARAYLHYEANQIAAADALLLQANATLNASNIVLPLVLSNITRAKIVIGTGHYSSADAILNELEQLSEVKYSARLQALVCYEKMRLRFYSGLRADDLIKQYELDSRCVHVETLFLDAYQEEHLFWLKSKLIAFLIDGNHAAASEYALKGVIKSLNMGCQRHLVTFYLFKSLSEFRLGRYRDACSTYNRALMLCQQHGYRRVLIDDSFGLHELWLQMQLNGDFSSVLDAPFMAEVQSDIDQWRQVVTPASASVSDNSRHLSLTDKEVEILTLLAEGLCNKKIGSRARIALTTVKWHLQNIFSKLDARNRTEAVLKAQELSLVDGSGMHR